MASLPTDVTSLLSLSVCTELVTQCNINGVTPILRPPGVDEEFSVSGTIKSEAISNNCHITVCQCADGMQILINRTNLIEYLKNPKYTGIKYTTYRSVKIATWFNITSGVFEGELMFMNHQIDALSTLNHSLFDNIYYKYLKNDNDISLPLNKNSKLDTNKTFKTRDYVLEKLIHTVDTILDILQTQSITNNHVKSIANQFYLFEN